MNNLRDVIDVFIDLYLTHRFLPDVIILKKAEQTRNNE